MSKIVKTTYTSVPAELNEPELLRLADTIAGIVQSAISEIATRVNMTMTISYWRIGQQLPFSDNNICRLKEHDVINWHERDTFMNKSAT